MKQNSILYFKFKINLANTFPRFTQKNLLISTMISKINLISFSFCYFKMENFNIGDLNSYLKTYFANKKLTPEIYKKIFYKISFAVYCLH